MSEPNVVEAVILSGSRRGEIVSLFGPARKIFDGLVETRNHFFGRTIPRVAYRLLQSLQSEFFLLRVLPFIEAISDEDQHVARIQTFYARVFVRHAGNHPERNSLGFEVLEIVRGALVPEDRSMTSRKNFHLGTNGIEKDDSEGHETVVSKIVCE